MIVFEDMISDMLTNEKLNSIVTELFIRGRKLNIRQYSTHYFVMKLSNKRELQQIGFNHSSDTDFQDFLNLYNIDIDTIDSTLTSDNPLRFRRNLVERI